MGICAVQCMTNMVEHDEKRPGGSVCVCVCMCVCVYARVCKVARGSVQLKDSD